jgi:hypothetical protein
MALEKLRLFLKVLDVVLEDEKIRLALAGQPDERLVVILDRPHHFFAAVHLYANRRAALDQQLEVLGFLEGLFGRASRFSTLL